MPSRHEGDAIVVGAGPNGLAAALRLAEAGLAVRVYEAADEPGGGCRTAELTLPGFRHDVCATVQALAYSSPAFRRFDLGRHGVRLLVPEIAFAHPLDGGRAAVCHADVAATAAGLGADGAAYRRLVGRLAEHGEALLADVLGDLRRLPRHPALLTRFGLPGLLPATVCARRAFDGDEARALFAGAAAHSMRRLSAPMTAAFGLALAVSAHATGWPVVAGGSGRLVDALVARLRELGVELECGSPVRSLADLPPADLTLLDITPRQFARLAGDKLPARYSRSLRRFRYGPGVYKVDYALAEPMPWANPAVRRAGTVHVGGTLAEIAASEAAVERGEHAENPFVLAVQPTVVDLSRAPEGRHVLWAYCHVPHGSSVDRLDAIERQLERFAPGFRDTVLARATRTAVEYEAYDANYVGGDINGGRAGLFQTVLGPVPQWSRYRTPRPGTYLCSSSTAPGGGVHGMCGDNAARAALRDLQR